MLHAFVSGAIRPRCRVVLLGETKVRSALWVLIEGVAVGDATNVTVLARKGSILSWVAAISVATGSAAAVIASAVAAHAAAACIDEQQCEARA